MSHYDLEAEFKHIATDLSDIQFLTEVKQNRIKCSKQWFGLQKLWGGMHKYKTNTGT